MTQQADLAAAFADIARNRHSCRSFLPEPLPAAKIAALLELAQLAPSDCNSQSWHALVVSGARLTSLRDTLYAHVAADGASSNDILPNPRYEGATLDRRRACGWGLYEAVGIQKGDRVASQRQAMENFRFFGAPHIALITVPASMGERGTLDAGIYLGYFLLAAQALGLAAVPQAAIAHYADVLRRELDVPADRRILCAVSFGVKDESHPSNQFRTTRASAEEYADYLE